MKEVCNKVVTQRWWRACFQHARSQFQLRCHLKMLSGQRQPTHFQDGKAAENAVHDTVIKAMVDNHTRDIEAAFKRVQEYSIMTLASQTLQLLPTQIGRLKSDLQEKPYAQGLAAPQLQAAFENTTKHPQPPAEKPQSDTSICSGSGSFDKPGDTSGYNAETDTQKTCNLVAAAQPSPLTRQLSTQHQKEVQRQLEQPPPGSTLPQASSEATPADLEHDISRSILSTEVGPAINPATSSCIECTSPVAPVSAAEDVVAVVSKSSGMFGCWLGKNLPLSKHGQTASAQQVGGGMDSFDRFR